LDSEIALNNLIQWYNTADKKVRDLEQAPIRIEAVSSPYALPGSPSFRCRNLGKERGERSMGIAMKIMSSSEPSLQAYIK
jgi:hypothetical protein